jgi:hypothetical protein
MEILIIKRQEPRSKNVKLSVEISISLTEKEQQLIKKYYEPSISDSDLREVGGLDVLSSLTIESSERSFELVPGISSRGSVSALPCPLGKFRLLAHADNGFLALGNMHRLVKAVIDVAKNKMEYLVALEAWQGKTVLNQPDN